MKKLKKYKRWPRNREVLNLKLKKICKQIDAILLKDFPTEILEKPEGKDLYRLKFKELFSTIGYKYDSDPTINFGWSNSMCTGGLTINFYFKDREGFRMHC